MLFLSCTKEKTQPTQTDQSFSITAKKGNCGTQAINDLGLKAIICGTFAPDDWIEIFFTLDNHNDEFNFVNFKLGFTDPMGNYQSGVIPYTVFQQPPNLVYSQLVLGNDDGFRLYYDRPGCQRICLRSLFTQAETLSLGQGECITRYFIQKRC